MTTNRKEPMNEDMKNRCAEFLRARGCDQLLVQEVYNLCQSEVERTVKECGRKFKDEAPGYLENNDFCRIVDAILSVAKPEPVWCEHCTIDDAGLHDHLSWPVLTVNFCPICGKPRPEGTR